MSNFIGLEVFSASIIPDENEGTYGHCQWSWYEELKPEIKNDTNSQKAKNLILRLIAGPVTEKILTGSFNYFQHPVNDLDRVTLIANYLTTNPKESKQIINTSWKEATKIIKKNWEIIEALALSLVENKQLEAKQINTIIKKRMA
jgi:ATP-dependent Zn protease